MLANLNITHKKWKHIETQQQPIRPQTYQQRGSRLCVFHFLSNGTQCTNVIQKIGSTEFQTWG